MKEMLNVDKNGRKQREEHRKTDTQEMLFMEDETTIYAIHKSCMENKQRKEGKRIE